MGRVRWLCLVLLMGLGASGQWVLWEQNFEGFSPTDPNIVKWRVVDSSWFHGEPAEVRKFPSGSRALYYGKIVDGKGTYEGTDPGSQHSDDIYGPPPLPFPRPPFSLDFPDFLIRVSFKYLREVEYYPAGDYDLTQVWTKAPWQTIWTKSSKDPSEKKWKSFISDPVSVTDPKLVFEFWAKDNTNNNFFGWLIDDIKVEAVVMITTSSLPEATVGEEYKDPVTMTAPLIMAKGGVRKNGEYKWRVEGLPEGLRASPKGNQLTISGTPQKAGDYMITVTVTDYADEASNERYPASSHTRTLLLRVRPKATQAHGRIVVTFNGPGPDIPGWTRTGLWHQAPGRYAAYFDPTTGNYDVGRRTYGELTSPKWDVSDRQGQEIRIRFDYYRDVENYPAGGYDKTYVQLRFDDREWITIWYKDCKDPSPELWADSGWISKDERDNKLVVPIGAKKMQIRFVFDSVDGLNNRGSGQAPPGLPCGWLVTYLEIELMPGVLGIVTERLPPAEIGLPYEVTLQARGGTPPYEWTTESRLPAGLRLERTGKLHGTPTDPRDIGTHRIVVKVTDQQRQSVGKEFTLVIGRRTTLFTEDFNADLSENWIVNELGLWHRTDKVKNVDLSKYGFVAYYGKDDATDPNYNTGTRTVGYLTSKEFSVGGAPAFEITFDYWREVEYYAAGGYDKTYVQARFLTATGWTAWYTLWIRDASAPSEKKWTAAKIGPHAIPTGATKMQIQFVFDSVDRFYNNYVGWLIDNVKVAIATAGSPLPSLALTAAAPRDEVIFFNYPNPVRDVHTTTFAVRGVEAELIRVEIYDLTGKLVWKGEAQGNELTWHTQDLSGLPLANGVYLYKVYVKVGETWIVSKVLKLVILR